MTPCGEDGQEAKLSSRLLALSQGVFDQTTPETKRQDLNLRPPLYQSGAPASRAALGNPASVVWRQHESHCLGTYSTSLSSLPHCASSGRKAVSLSVIVALSVMPTRLMETSGNSLQCQFEAGGTTIS